MGVPDSPPAPTRFGGGGLKASTDLKTRTCVPESAWSAVGAVAAMSDPVGPGVWRKNEDRQKWTLYNHEIAEMIFTAFTSGESFAEWGNNSIPKKRKRDNASLCRDVVTYRVEFDRMKEVDLTTMAERDVKIIQVPISEINYTPSMDPVEAGVWWKSDHGKWHCYTEATEQAIRCAWRKKDQYIIIKKAPTLKAPRGEECIVNLLSMKQMDPLSGHKIPIRMIANLWMPDETVPDTKNLTVFSLSSKLLEEALQRLISLEFIQVRLAKMIKYPYKLLTLELNKYIHGVEGSKYSRNEVQRVYKEFRTAVDSTMKTIPGCCGQLLRIVRQTPNSDEGKVPIPNTMAIMRHVFYGAPACKVGSILKNGLDTVINQKQSDCFRPTSDHFEKLCTSDGVLKLVLFLAVVPKNVSDTSTIPVVELVHYLPVAAVTLKGLEEHHIHASEEAEPVAHVGSSGPPPPSSLSSGEQDDEKDVPAADFHDFNSHRTETDITAGQIWALYDDQDGMPRFYGCIAQVSLSPFTVNMCWLDSEPTAENKSWSRDTGLAVTCGNFQMVMSSVIKREVNFFSHKVLDKTGDGFVKIYPGKSQVWAIFSDWDRPSGPKRILNGQGDGYTYKYEMVEILDDYSEEGVTTVKLTKVKDFQTLFVRDDEPMAIRIFLPSELRRFSHSVPAERLYGNDAFGIPRGALELDPAATPLDLINSSPNDIC